MNLFALGGGRGGKEDRVLEEEGQEEEPEDREPGNEIKEHSCTPIFYHLIPLRILGGAGEMAQH